MFTHVSIQIFADPYDSNETDTREQGVSEKRMTVPQRLWINL